MTVSYSEMKPMTRHLDVGEFPDDRRSKSPSLGGSNDDLTSGLLYDRPRLKHVSNCGFVNVIGVRNSMVFRDGFRKYL